MNARRGEIVVIDDDHGDLELAKVAFEGGGSRLEVATFDSAQRGWEYLSAVRDEPRPRVVLLDLNMPGFGGRDLLERLKRDPAMAKTVVVVFTTSDSRSDVSECYARHANAFITKPSDLSQYRTIARRIEDFWFETARLPE